MSRNASAPIRKNSRSLGRGAPEAAHVSIEYVAPATSSGSSSREGTNAALTRGREDDHGMAVWMA